MDREQSRPSQAPRLRRAERREQILAAATRAFAAAGGFRATGLDDVADAAGVSRAIIYRHFASKSDLYRAAVDRAAEHLHASATDSTGQLTESSIPGMVSWAAGEPAAFRLLFRHALREPEFADEVEAVRASMVAALQRQLPPSAAAPSWRRWAARLATATVIEGILAWLDEGQPDPDDAPGRLMEAVDGVYRALDASS